MRADEGTKNKDNFRVHKHTHGNHREKILFILSITRPCAEARGPQGKGGEQSDFPNKKKHCEARDANVFGGCARLLIPWHRPNTQVEAESPDGGVTGASSSTTTVPETRENHGHTHTHTHTGCTGRHSRGC